MNRLKVILLAIAVFPVLLGSENGVAEDQNKDRTGAPGSDNPCNNPTCHTSGSFNPTTGISILNEDTMTPVDEYIPGATYIMEVTVTAGTGVPSRYGFQGTAVLASDASNAGTFQNPFEDVQLENVGGRHLVEHSNPSQSNTFRVEWVAPESGSGQVDFYVSAIASNNSGSDSGDGYDGEMISLTEMVSNVAEKVEQKPYLIRNDQFTALENGSLEIYNSSGSLMNSLFIKKGETRSLNTSGITLVRFSTSTDTFSDKIYLNK